MEKVRRTPASLKKMVEIFGMEILHKGRDFDNTVVTISDVNRPALQLVGFYDYLTISACRSLDAVKCAFWTA